MIRQTLTAGIVIRSRVRSVLLLNGFDFVENKGFLSSDFIVKCKNVEALNRLKQAIAKFLD